jgi:hypothetical protein
LLVIWTLQTSPHSTNPNAATRAENPANVLLPI